MNSVISLCRRLLCVVLFPVLCGSAAIRINEFVASNDTGLVDEDGDHSDWIEIYNPDATAVSLSGYHLTDDPTKLDKWTFPAVTLNPGAYLVVFASGKNRIDPAGKLHTNFVLDRNGEYLALVAPNGTILTSFTLSFPPQFDNVSYGLSSTNPVTWAFFTAPTPNATNSTAAQRAGPVIIAEVTDPPQPVTGPLTITATLQQVNSPISTLTLYYRLMFGAETNVVMKDDGTGADAFAGDGIWTGVIPAGAFSPGQMTRWRLVATDTFGTQTKEPAYRFPTNSPQYFGTVAADSRIQTLLPVLHWFIQNPGAAATDAGARGSLYYNGEFYDNVFFSLHGQSTTAFPKHSYNISFNSHFHFNWKTNINRVSDIDLLTNWADKSKVRHVLAYEMMRLSGVAAHLGETIRVQQNGGFYSTADFLERGNEDYLDRAGLNKNGALYKVYGNTLNKAAGDTGYTGVEKKTRQFENNADLQALIDGLALSGTNLINFIYDNVDIPRCVDMLAANSLIRNSDMHVKNWYIYRDTGRSGEWAILPWDLDLSQGRVWNSTDTYFDNRLYVDSYVVSGDVIRLVGLMFSDTKMRSMIMRRLRTVTDEFLQPPPAANTPESSLYIERRLNEQSALIDPPSIVPSDAERDFEKWGSWVQSGGVVPYTSTDPAVETMAEAITRYKKEYLPGRRNFIYNTQVVGKGGEIPLPQDTIAAYNLVPLVSAGMPCKAYAPTNSSLGLAWIGSATQEPYNDSAWLSGTTGVGYERGTGYESLIGLNVDAYMKTNTGVYIRIPFDVPDPTIFDRLELHMKFDDGFVAYMNGFILVSSNTPASTPYNAVALSNREAGPNYDIFDVTSKKGNLRVGRNILAIFVMNDASTSSDLLALPELYGGTTVGATKIQPVINFGAYDVSPANGNQDAEYIQLINTNSIAVDLGGWKLAGGIDHDFIPGTVIPAKGSLYVCPKAEAFRARTVGPKGGQGLFVQGGYRGHLSNLGETIYLLDQNGATNSVMSYPGQPSDAQRYLVLSEVMYHPAVDALAEYVELMNISDTVTLDISGLHFTQGLEFSFTNSPIKTLAPGGRVLVVRNLASFTAVYGSGLPVAGVFANNSALDNNGDHIKLEDENNETVLEFSYSDTAPWPTAADGLGYSLVLVNPESKPDPTLASSWRASVFKGGTPGGTDAVAFPADPSADANGNGQPDLLDYALGNDLGMQPIFPALFQASDSLRFSYPVSLGADQVKIEALYSTDLVNWQDATPGLQPGITQNLGDGRVILNFVVTAPIADQAQSYLRLKVSLR